MTVWHFLTDLIKVYFNSHAHVERDAQQSVIDTATSDFNSHAHVERDWSAENVKEGAVISTHTLTWSVTTVVRFFGQYIKISTHTLTWSVTSSAGRVCAGALNFNSHAHVERDSA